MDIFLLILKELSRICMIVMGIIIIFLLMKISYDFEEYMDNQKCSIREVKLGLAHYTNDDNFIYDNDQIKFILTGTN